MRILNRSAIILEPTQALVDWINDVDPYGKRMSYEELNQEPSIYLLPEYGGDDELAEILEDEYEEIFENELFGWYTDESLWPNRRTYELFRAWFRVVPASVVHDVDTAPYATEEA